MAVKFLFFAQCADWAGRREMEVPLSAPKSVEKLVQDIPELSAVSAHRNILRIAVNKEFSGFDKEVKNGDEIAFLPPVSGG